jgi:hypothetical protein
MAVQNLRLKIQNPYFIRVLTYRVSFESIAQNSRPMGFLIKNGVACGKAALTRRVPQERYCQLVRAIMA